VLANGPRSVHQALLFCQLSNDITYLTNDTPLTDGEAEQLEARGIDVANTRVRALDVTQDRLTGVRLADDTVVPVDAFVACPRGQVLAGRGGTPGTRRRRPAGRTAGRGRFCAAPLTPPETAAAARFGYRVGRCPGGQGAGSPAPPRACLPPYEGRRSEQRTWWRRRYAEARARSLRLEQRGDERLERGACFLAVQRPPTELLDATNNPSAVQPILIRAVGRSATALELPRAWRLTLLPGLRTLHAQWRTGGTVDCEAWSTVSEQGVGR